MLGLQLCKQRLVIGVLFAAECLPTLVGWDVGGSAIKTLKDFTLTALAKRQIIIIEQDFDPNSALDKRQLAVEQAAGEDLQITAQPNLSTLLGLFVLTLLYPDLTPEMQRIARQGHNDECGQAESNQCERVHRQLRRRGIS